MQNFENRLRFDKVTESSNVHGNFFETQCRCSVQLPDRHVFVDASPIFSVLYLKDYEILFRGTGTLRRALQFCVSFLALLAALFI